MTLPAQDASASSQSPVDILAQKTSGTWSHLKDARVRAQEMRTKNADALKGLDTDDTSIVVFGSLARDEATEQSDVDWTLLIDGMADPKHMDAALCIQEKLDAIKTKAPGQEGTFGNLSFSHQILHWIGGEDDSNTNTTRRILLLLESKPLGKSAAWERVRSNILHRYLTEDHGLWVPGKERGVPLFLLNDIARYWRTMVVDFAYKQRTRNNKGYALRNIKLGLSRKLIYASGMLACLRCHLDISNEDWSESSRENPQALIDKLQTTFDKTPLEILADTLIRDEYENLRPESKKLFDAYDAFIGLLNDKPMRDYLDNLSINEMDNDKKYTKAQTVRREFGDALLKIFLGQESPLRDLTIQYGVF